MLGNCQRDQRMSVNGQMISYGQYTGALTLNDKTTGKERDKHLQLNRVEASADRPWGLKSSEAGEGSHDSGWKDGFNSGFRNLFSSQVVKH